MSAHTIFDVINHHTVQPAVGHSALTTGTVLVGSGERVDNPLGRLTELV